MYLIAAQAEVQRRVRQQQADGVARGGGQQIAAQGCPAVLLVEYPQVHLQARRACQARQQAWL